MPLDSDIDSRISLAVYQACEYLPQARASDASLNLSRIIALWTVLASVLIGTRVFA